MVKDEVFRIEKDSVKDSETDIRRTSTTMKVVCAPPKQYGDSTFQGHSVSVYTQDEIVPALHAIYSDSRTARVTMCMHTTFREVNNFEHYEDDKEWGVVQTILDILKAKNITNQLVCVSRWYGGKHLGPAPFTYIKEAAQTVLDFATK